MRSLVLLLLLALCGSLPVAAETLQQRLGGLRGLTGEFEQTLYSRDGDVLEQSSGRFSLLRPGYLSWHIQAPDEQLLLAANETLWHYDVELETATRRRIPAGNPTSPLTILGGDSDELETWYRVQALGEDSWSLEPRFDDAEFARVELSFERGLPVEMRILDSLGRRTLISLGGLDPTAVLNPEDFAFEPPPGIDIYDSDEP